MGRLHDPSTEQIKRKLTTPRSRNVVEAHAGVASVATDGGIAPRQPDCAGEHCAANAATNAALAHAGRATPHKQVTPGEMVAAGLTGSQFAGLPSPTDN